MRLIALIAAALLSLAGCDSTSTPQLPAKGVPQLPPLAAKAQELALREIGLRQHLAAHPDDTNARLALANLYYDMDRPHRAVPLYLAVLRERPEDLSARTDLGTCYKEMGHLGQARIEYERVLQKHAGHVQATYNLAVVNELTGDRAKAAELWERVATLAPGTEIAKTAAAHAAAARRPDPETATKAANPEEKEPGK
ncbi:MAG TPA: tetratricopeptide repeat protein [Planctomycetota bacterium]|nr:tetratricopeptide repeat protein [Planctomycetota bacterium]HRR82484.1 tetratricopeptide repeat protein [Planctomycetota bacterium]HRT96189.1 tetratricopeptide repeat protein [Planctomycetota bacterium]